MDIPHDLRGQYERAREALRYGQCADPTRFEGEIRLIERIALMEEENAQLKAELNHQSLLRSATTQPIQGCYCQPGRCMAPVIMGRQMPCLDPEKAARAGGENAQTQ